MRDGTATHTRIREQAIRLFVERGIDAVSMRDIAEAVGIRPSTIYVHWKSRDALVRDLFRAGYAEYGRRVAEIARAEGSFAARFEAVVRLICRLHTEDPTLFNFILLSQHDHLLQIPPDDRNPMETLQQMVAAAMAAGEIPSGDPGVVTAALVGIVLQPATFRAYGRLDRDLEAMADELVGLCLKLVRQ
jgi:AcrR family transcriptional regulator